MKKCIIFARVSTEKQELEAVFRFIGQARSFRLLTKFNDEWLDITRTPAYN